MNEDKLPDPLSAHSSGLVEPRLVRGGIPEPGRQVRKKKKSPWDPHIELARQFPARLDPNGTWSMFGHYSGGWVECAAQLKGGPKARAHAMQLDRRRLLEYINRAFPLDRFQIAIRTEPGTWCDLRLYLRYLRTLTEEENRVDRIQRRKRYDRMMEHRQEKAAERELQRRRIAEGQG